MKNATYSITAAFGVLMGLAGIEHGIGEILQGNLAPGGLMILSWPESAFFRIVAGEPAMTVLPNLLVTGILAIIVSLAYLLWATLFVRRKHGGLVLILLAMAMLPVGAGIFPPLMGFVIGILATKINAPLTWWRTRLSPGLRHVLAKVWPQAFVICLIAWLMLFPGINLLGYFFGIHDPQITVILICVAFGSLAIAYVSGFGHDSDSVSTVSDERAAGIFLRGNPGTKSKVTRYD